MREDGKAGDILIYGNAGYFPERDLRYSFEDRRIAVVCPHGGETSPSGRIRWYKSAYAGAATERLFHTYDFAAIVFVSGYLTYGNEPEDEMQELRRIFQLCRKYKVDQAVCLVSQDLRHDETQTDRWMDHMILEWLCKYYADRGIKVSFVGSPYLADPSCDGDYFRKMFACLEEGKDWTFPEAPEKKTDFITSEDMCAFLSRYLDVPQKEQFVELDLRSYTECTFGDVASKLREIYPERNIVCSGETAPAPVQYDEDYAREKLGWFARYDVFHDIEGFRGRYLSRRKKKESMLERLRERQTSGSRLLEIIEILLGAAVMELLNRLLQNSVQFRMVDVRLLYVILISSVYGMKAGVLSSILASASLLAAYAARGISPAMLFYEPSNWLAFALLFAASGFCGLEREQQDEKISTLTENADDLEKKNEYTDQLYEEALSSKNEYRRNLIQSRDGFGRVYSAVQRLAVSDPSKVFVEAIGVFEDILANRSVAIYSISERQSGFARLEVSSRELKGHKQKSIRLSDYDDVVSALDEGGLWVNRDMIKEKPMYAAGAYSDGKLRIMVVLWDAGFDQMNSYYENQIRILTGLTQTFMLEAWSFQEAIAKSTHIGETHFLTEEVFRKELLTRRDMADSGVASYSLFRIKADGHDTEEMAGLLAGKLRKSDLATRSSIDGDYYVLAVQADESSEHIILDRFRKIGLNCNTVEIRGGSSQ